MPKKPKRTERRTDWQEAYAVAVNKIADAQLSNMNFVRASLAESHRTIAGLREIERKQQERIAELESVVANLKSDRDAQFHDLRDKIARLNRENLAQSEIIAKRDVDQVKRDIQIADLRAEVECGDELIARQRQHCIRLTEIKNSAQAFLHSWGMGRVENFPTQGFGCVLWHRRFEIHSTKYLALSLQEQIAALEVDSSLKDRR
jgi:hypothetical protein